MGKRFELSLKHRDRNLAKSIILFLIINLKKDNILIEIVKKFPDLDNIVIEALKTNDYIDDYKLMKYFYHTGNYEELFLIAIEKFFKCEWMHDRQEYLPEAKKSLKGIKNY